MERMDMCQLVTQCGGSRHSALKAGLVVMRARLSGVVHDQKVIISIGLRGRDTGAMLSCYITIKRKDRVI